CVRPAHLRERAEQNGAALDLRGLESFRRETLNERRLFARHGGGCLVDFGGGEGGGEKECGNDRQFLHHSFSTSIDAIADLTTKIRSFLLRSSGKRKKP